MFVLIKQLLEASIAGGFLPGGPSCDKRVGTCSPSPRPMDGERGWSLGSITMASGFINQASVMSFHKVQKVFRIMRASGVVTAWRY